MVEAFPDRPKGMHGRTYQRLRRTHDLAEEKAMMGLSHFADRQLARARR